MAAAAPRTLDTALRQVMIDFFDDELFHWHHRLLLVQLGGASWIAASPDLEIETLDLTRHRVLPVGRASPFPARCVGNMYIFDPLPAAELDELVQQALQLAAAYGVTATAPSGFGGGGEWRVADPALVSFDDVVSDATMTEADRTVIKDDKALALMDDGNGREIWVFVERVPKKGHDEWVDSKRSGPGRDLRIASNMKDSAGARFINLSASMGCYRKTTFADWPFRGPSAATEMLQGVLKSGNELAQFDLFWGTRSGVAKGSAVANAHRNIFTCLSLMQSYDQYDAVNSAGFEFLSRWALMIQAAVRKNPRVPDFVGLDSFLSHSFDETGGVVTTNFAKFVAEEQKSEAIVMKQNRLWHEELDAESKKRKGDGKGKDKSGGRGGGGGGAGGDSAAAASP